MDAESLLELFQRKSTVQDGPNQFILKRGSIHFQNVGFSYDGKKEVIQDFSFHAGPGQRIALVGETGGGKSTILGLLFRFYDVQQGKILIDDQNIKDVSLHSLREYVGVVPQDPALFNDTVMENVRYSKLGASDEEVMDACRSAAIHDKILTFTEGYQTRVGENGVKLSGGELQRVAIARVILKNPDIILLDEATSAVDTETEAQIQKALHNLTKGRTTITIAHRLSTVTNSDVIVVIKQGKIIEQGSPRDLLEAKGKFSELWLKQVEISLPTADDQPTKGKLAGEDQASKPSENECKTHLSEASSSSGKSLRATAPEFIPSKASASRRQKGTAAKDASSSYDDSAQELQSSFDVSMTKSQVDEDRTQQKRKLPAENLSNATGSEAQRDISNSRPEGTRQTETKKKRPNPAQRRRNNKSEPSGSATKRDQQEGPSDALTSDESAGLSGVGLQSRRVSAPARPLTSITNSGAGGRPQRRRAQRWQNRKRQSSELAPTSTSGDWSTDTLHLETPVVRLPGSSDAGEPASSDNTGGAGTSTGSVHFAPGF